MQQQLFAADRQKLRFFRPLKSDVPERPLSQVGDFRFGLGLFDA